MISNRLTAVVALGLVSLFPLAAAAQDGANGETLFAAQCASCHTVEDGGASIIGPNLFGVLGSIAANRGIEFEYSDPLIDSGVIWDAGNLDAWLESPVDFVPGNSMPTPGLAEASERADIIEYLGTLE